MNSTTDIFIDGKPLAISQPAALDSFEEFCRHCSASLHHDGRAIRAVHVDGVEVNCATPPPLYQLRQARRIEVSSCLLEELLQAALDQQTTSARNLAREVAVLSTDCLVQMPQETFEKWRNVLESLKSIIGFIPKFFQMAPLSPSLATSLDEEVLTNSIQEIKDAVDTSRRALETQDIVQFSDTLELRILPWLKKHEGLSQMLGESVVACARA